MCTKERSRESGLAQNAAGMHHALAGFAGFAVRRRRGCRPSHSQAVHILWRCRGGGGLVHARRAAGARSAACGQLQRCRVRPGHCFAQPNRSAPVTDGIAPQRCNLVVPCGGYVQVLRRVREEHVMHCLEYKHGPAGLSLPHRYRHAQPQSSLQLWCCAAAAAATTTTTANQACAGWCEEHTGNRM